MNWVNRALLEHWAESDVDEEPYDVIVLHSVIKALAQEVIRLQDTVAQSNPDETHSSAPPRE